MSDSSSITVLIPRTVQSRDELLDLIATRLEFPSWFGRNWDALFDLLCDLSWLKERKIIIIHEGHLEMPSDEYSTYVKLLSDAAGSWQVNPGEHELIVSFPD